MVPYPPVVAELVSFLLALVGADQQLQTVLQQQLLSHIRTEVAASASEGVGTAAVLRFRVAPQNVHDLPRTRVGINQG